MLSIHSCVYVYAVKTWRIINKLRVALRKIGYKKWPCVTGAFPLLHLNHLGLGILSAPIHYPNHSFVTNLPLRTGLCLVKWVVAIWVCVCCEYSWFCHTPSLTVCVGKCIFSPSPVELGGVRWVEGVVVLLHGVNASAKVEVPEG